MMSEKNYVHGGKFRLISYSLLKYLHQLLLSTQLWSSRVVVPWHLKSGKFLCETDLKVNNEEEAFK